MIHVFGISGKAGAGKDTLAAYMMDSLSGEGNLVKKAAFADALKQLAEQYFGGICDIQKKDPVSRAVLQGIGHMFREEVSDTYWIQRVAQTVALVQEDNPGYKNYYFFITDVRYENEANEFHDFFGGRGNKAHLIRLEGRTSLTGDAALHPSETELDRYQHFDYVFKNNGSIEELYAFGDSILDDADLNGG